jgi:hypothetical protein
MPCYFLCDEWNLEIVVQCEVGDIPWGVGDRAQNLGLESLEYFDVRRFGTSPYLNTVSPDRFQYAFVNQNFVFQAEFGFASEEP